VLGRREADGFCRLLAVHARRARDG
jgi:hypothetical protein